MAIAVTLPVPAPTGLQATLQEGGSLQANTTYYFIVIAYDQAYYSPQNLNVFCYHSPISQEQSFTTTETHKSVRINWTNAPGATRYQILLSTVSGNYTNSGGYGTTAETIGNLITSGTTGYVVTALSTEIYAFHYIQTVNNVVGNISKNLGLIKVDFSGIQTHTLDQVHTAIVAAGFTDYVYYDGYNFILKGWFNCDGTDGGNLIVESKRLIFLKGGIANKNPNYIMRFGRWTSDLVGASYPYTCSIDIVNSRYPIYGNSEGNLRIYGSVVTFGQARLTTLTETKNITFFIGNGNASLSRIVNEFRDSILAVQGRSMESVIKDLKWAQLNNFGNFPHIRLKIWTTTNMPYYKGGTFYNCDFVTFPTPLQIYAGSSGVYQTAGYYTDFYDCNFPSYPEGMIGFPYFRYTTLDADHLYSNAYVNINYSLKLKVIDTNGNPVSGVLITGTDANGNAIEFIEQNGYDRLVTGNKYLNLLTGETGEVDYYVKSYKIELNPANIQYPNSTDIIKTNYYPIKIIFSKDGYNEYSIIIDVLNKKTEAVVTLENTKPNITGVDMTDCSRAGLNDGRILIIADSALEYSIDGEEYQDSNIFTGLAPGHYTVYARKGNLTASMQGIEISEPPVVYPIITGIDITHCTRVGANDGIIDMSAEYDREFLYSVDGIHFQESNVFYNLSPRIYLCVVKGSDNVLSAVTSIEITEPVLQYSGAYEVKAAIKQLNAITADVDPNTELEATLQDPSAITATIKKQSIKSIIKNNKLYGKHND
jgi:hypothetical protein